MANRVYGWKRQEHDDRDQLFSVGRHAAAALSNTQDLHASMGPFLDQEDIGSCGPTSVAEMISFNQKVEGRKVQTASRLFIYYNTRLMMGDGAVSQDSGVDNRTMLKAVAKCGYCFETLWPYVTSRYTKKPPSSCYQAATVNKITKYSAVLCDALHARGCLASGNTFVWGGEVFRGIESDEAAATGIIPMPGQNETAVGGHDMTCCGATLVDKPGIMPGNVWPAGTIRLRNHWSNSPGHPWGDGGYCYIPFDYAFNSDLAGDFWTLSLAN